MLERRHGTLRSRMPRMPRMPCAAALAACVASAACAASLGAQTIRIGAPVVVATGTAQRPLYETQVAVDPSRPSRLLAVSMVGRDPSLKFPAGLDRQACAAFLSLDAGVTWARYEFGTTWCYDPWVAITPDGQALATMVGAHAALPGQGRAGLVAFHSADGGGTWDSLPAGLGSDHDHPVTAVDPSPGPRRGWIYISSHRGRRADDGRYRYGFWMARSRNGGKTFDDPVWVVPNNLHNLAEMPVTLADGTLIESFVDAAFTPDSADGGAAEAVFDRRRAWVARSTDGGFTYSPPLFVTDACGPPPHFQLSAMAADQTTGTFAGRLYHACRQHGAGPIVVTHSRDRGERWSAARAVRAASAGWTSTDTMASRIPAIAVNGRGVVLVAWLDWGRRRGVQCEQTLYVSASRDGGRSFSPGQPASTSAGCPGGDYFGLVALPGGAFRLLWPEVRDGVPQLRTVIAEVDVAAADPP